MKIKMLVDIGGLYNGKDIPKKAKLGTQIKITQLTLSTKVGLKLSSLLLRKLPQLKLKKKKLMPKHYMGKKKRI